MSENLKEKKEADNCSCGCFKGNRTMKWIVAIVLILSLSGIVVVSILRDRIINDPLNQVSINGQGKISYQPDIANVTLGVQIDKAETAEQALSVLNEKVKKIITIVTGLGIDSKNIKNQTYSLYPYYDYIDGINKLNGYNANQQVIIKIDGVDGNFDLLNRVIAESAKAGANQVLGVSFESSNIENLKQEARILAIKDAKLKAQTLSQAVGISLGDIVGWWENIINPSPYYDYSYGGMGGGGPIINSGSYEVNVELTLNYKIKKEKK